ncbi:MAG: hypothetical protein ACTHMT_03495 [Verrucomicrobiota bacterium]
MATTKEAKNRGCFFYGILTFVLVFIGVVAGLYFGTRKAIKTAVANYTTNAPVAIPRLTISETEQKQVAERIQKNAEQAIKSGKGGTIALDGKELNILLAQSPDLKSLAPHIYVEPAGTNLQAQLSLPLDQFKLWEQFSSKFGPEFKGRYLNGTATLGVASTNGQLSIRLRGLEVNGKPLPEAFITKVETQNLAAEANQNTNFRPVLDKIDSIQITNSQVEVHFK